MSKQIVNPLKQEVDELFKSALERTKNLSPFREFHRLLEQSHQRLQEPMRVAIVGLIKAGKSTLMNALLGESVVATGTVETTFNVNWLKYGESRLIVHFKNDLYPPEEKSFSQLADLTRRHLEHQQYLLSIKYIEVFHPNEILHIFNIIDTPGLNSSYQDDSKNTKEFLQMHGDKLTEITRKESANADAVMYLFSQSLGQLDAKFVEQLQKSLGGNTTPINAIGVLTKVDSYSSDSNVTDPLVTARDIIQDLWEHPPVRRLFYIIQPVCGLLALGAKTLTEEHWQTLTDLAKLPSERFEILIGSAHRFIKSYEDISISHTERKQLLENLGQYGISLAYNYLKKKEVSSREELRKKLLEHTGIEELEHLIRSHFGNRSFLIKLGTVLQEISTLSFQEKKRLIGDALKILEEISSEFDKLEHEQAFQELKVLRSYYDNKLNFNDCEQKQLLEITGEYGISCAERLGFNKDDALDNFDEMIRVASERINYWNIKSNDPFANGNGRETTVAARILTRSYERILYRIQKAKEYSQKAKEYLYI